MKGNFWFFIVACAISAILPVLCSKKIGRDGVLSWAMKILSPICIILFYLSGISIIVPIMEKIQITDSVVLSNVSVRVAVDSAIVTLLVNVLLSFLNSPIKVEVEARSRQDLEQILVYCNRGSKIDYTVTIRSKYKWILYFT
jgi:hypothetical protein